MIAIFLLLSLVYLFFKKNNSMIDHLWQSRNLTRSQFGAVMKEVRTTLSRILQEHSREWIEAGPGDWLRQLEVYLCEEGMLGSS